MNPLVISPKESMRNSAGIPEEVSNDFLNGFLTEFLIPQAIFKSISNEYLKQFIKVPLISLFIKNLCKDSLGFNCCRNSRWNNRRSFLWNSWIIPSKNSEKMEYDDIILNTSLNGLQKEIPMNYSDEVPKWGWNFWIKFWRNLRSKV